jgi:hypothetical protein
MFEHDFAQKQDRATRPGGSHHNRGMRVLATPVRRSTRWISITFVAALTLACHPAQNFPAHALAAHAPTPRPEFFESKSSGLEDRATITDLSALSSEPAGAHGFVRAELGHFVDDRGIRLRFFGINLSGPAGLPDAVTGARLARHFRKLGFNAVRLHALDAPGALLSVEGQVDAEALGRLDNFCAELKAQGIYFSLGLHALSGYPGLEGDALTRFPHGEVLDRFHEPFLAAEGALARALLGHVNPKTARPYSDEPALLYLELNNEDSIFPFAAGSTDDLPPSYRAELARGYAASLAERTAEGLRAPRSADEEAKGGLPTFHDSPSAVADYAHYLHETELRAVTQLATFVRKDLGLHSMLLNSQANVGGLAGLLREAAVSDFMDVHGYWDRPSGAGGAGGAGPWTIRNIPQVTAPEAGTLGVLASYRIFGKPFSVSEFATPAPNDYAVETLPLFVGIAGLQDWDALFAFAYADQKPEYEPSRINGVFDFAGHPAKLAFVTMAASAFRRGLIAPGRGRVELSVPSQPNQLPFTENALPTLWAEQGVPMSATTLRQVGVTLRPGTGELSVSDPPHVQGTLGSDTGELLWERDGAHPRFSVDAPALKLVCGRVAKSALRFESVTFEFADFFGNYACASLLALDEQPIASSRRLLLTVAGRAQNAHPSAGLTQGAADLGAGPALAQFVPFSLSLPSAAWQAQALDSAGAPTHALVVVPSAGQSTITTTLGDAALSFAIER